MWWFTSVVLAYFLGSIPSAYYAIKWMKGSDLRDLGSGNLGFTNCARVIGWKCSIPILIFDILKGVAAVSIARCLVPNQELLAVLAGLVAVLGHNWTIFLGFKGGGKGVATSAGVFAALAPVPFIITLVVFLITISTTRYMSLGSMLGGVTLAASSLILIIIQSPAAPSLEVLVFSLMAASLIIIRHITNIRLLLRGEESKLGAKKTNFPEKDK